MPLRLRLVSRHPQLLDEKYMGPPVTYGKSLNKEFSMGASPCVVFLRQQGTHAPDLYREKGVDEDH